MMDAPLPVQGPPLLKIEKRWHSYFTKQRRGSYVWGPRYPDGIHINEYWLRYGRALRAAVDKSLKEEERGK